MTELGTTIYVKQVFGQLSLPHPQQRRRGQPPLDAATLLSAVVAVRGHHSFVAVALQDSRDACIVLAQRLARG